MSQKEKHWDDYWYLRAPLIAFFIICVAAGGIIGYQSSKIVGMLIGILLGVIVGLKLTWLIVELFSIFFPGKEESKTWNKQGNNSSYQRNNTPSEESINPFVIYYALLEAKAEDDMEAIKRNYHRLLKEYHPDKLGSNASPSIQNHAKEMTQKIIEAYEMIKLYREAYFKQ